MQSNSQNTLQEKTNLPFVTLVSTVAAVGGLLFGYDTAVISGAIGFLQSKFALSTAMTGWAVSSLLIGCMIGSGAAGVLSDRIGRKKMLILAALLFAFGSVFSAIGNTITAFVLARMVGGLGVGIASILSPLYIAEIAPARIRGRLVSLNQLAIVFGISAVFFINEKVASFGSMAWNISTGWRYMVGIGAIPGILFFLLLLFVPESPRWLQKQGYSEKALAILTRVNGPHHAEEEIREIEESISTETGSFGSVFTKNLKMPLFVGITLAILQQVTGINAIMYYAPEIFKTIGAGVNTSLLQTVLVGLVNLVFTIVSIWLIDKVGRKILLIVGSALMAVCLFAVGLAFSTGHLTGPWVLVFILLYVASFAVSLGPVMWVIISEIFPTRVRGLTASIATVAQWAADYLVSQLFPIMISGIGPAITFYIFMIMSVICVFFTIKYVPETKGKTLEEIERSWVRS